MKQILAGIFAIAIIVSLIAISFTFNQVSNEQERLENDIQYRSYLLTNGLKESVEPNFINKSNSYLQDIVNRFADNKRIAGLAVVDNNGSIVAVSSNLPKQIPQVKKLATEALDSDKDSSDFASFGNNKVYIYVSPLHDKKSVVGALAIVQSADYLDARLLEIWKNNLLRLFIQIFLISVSVILIIRWIILAPIRNLVESLKLSRKGIGDYSNNKILNNPIFKPLMQEVGSIQNSLIEARIAASEEARIQLEKLDSPWTAERLKVFVKDILGDKKIFVVSNREPYIHTKNGNKIEHHFPASGMVTALEPIMQATGGMWIAHGSGSADKLVVDKNDKLRVPPDEPKYTLKRVWLTADEEKGYYEGFSNEGIWPLCHMTHTRPIFRKENWDEYVKVNEKFAESLLKEIKNEKDPIIFIQDFHFMLLPRLIKDKRPDATIGMFWHIPWPNAENFSICPWRKEMLDGMMGADILGFHTQLHCNNFITTVSRELEALVDMEQFTVTKNNHATYVKPFPISIAFTKSSVSKGRVEEEAEKSKKILKNLGIKTKYLGVGVDRLDYTKGILERLKAVELFLIKYPSFIGEFTFLQISAPSRTTVKEYQDFYIKVQAETERINNLYKKNGWKPIIFLNQYHAHNYIYSIYRASDFCLVTSLHDGMNLVAKEFVASRDDEKGVLILSQFAGASRELHDALIINPYNGEQTADAIYTALTMKPTEQKRRMQRMRDIVKSHNVYRWSAEFIKTMVDLG